MSEVLAVKEIVLLNFLKALHITFSKLANSLLILVWDIYYQKVIGLSEYRRNTIKTDLQNHFVTNKAKKDSIIEFCSNEHWTQVESCLDSFHRRGTKV